MSSESDSPTSRSRSDSVQRKPHIPGDDLVSRNIILNSAASPRPDKSQTPNIYPDGFPVLQFSYKRRYVVSYVFFLLVCNFVVPVILFYPLITLTPLSRRHVIGIGSAALGLSSCFDAPFRLWRLVKHRETYGPLGNDTWWHLDFVMWTYSFACIVFSIPLAIAPAIEYYNFFLMSTVMLVAPIGFVFFISLFAPKWRVWCSSDPPGTPMKPAAFYTIEDIAAVDFKCGRDYRKTLQERWRVSPPFRILIRHVTIYWTVCSALYCVVTALVSWLTPLNFAFGFVLGQMFIWGAVCALGCKFLVKWELKREKAWLLGQRLGSSFRDMEKPVN